METGKTLRLTMAEIIYGLVLVTGIIGSYTLMQYQVSTLESGRLDNRIRIEKLEERVRLQEIEVSKISAKLDEIKITTDVIKNAVLDASFRSKR